MAGDGGGWVRFDLGDGMLQLPYRFRELAKKIDDMRPLFERISKDFMQIEREQFASHGARGGTPWAPLRRSYSRWKRRTVGSQPLMVLHDKLRHSLTSGQPLSMSAHNLNLGTDVWYGALHQTGYVANLTGIIQAASAREVIQVQKIHHTSPEAIKQKIIERLQRQAREIQSDPALSPERKAELINRLKIEGVKEIQNRIRRGQGIIEEVESRHLQAPNIPPAVPVPARPIIKILERDKARWRRFANQWVDREAAAVGL